MPEPTDRLIEELRNAEADYRMSLKDGRGRLIEAAVDLLAAGIDGSGVVALAGDDRSERLELERDLDLTLAELDLEPLVRADAAVRAARTVAVAVIEGQTSLRDAAGLVWRLWTETGHAAGPLAWFASTADEFGYSPRVISEQDFRRAAEEFLSAVDQAPTG